MAQRFSCNVWSSPILNRLAVTVVLVFLLAISAGARLGGGQSYQSSSKPASSSSDTASNSSSSYDQRDPEPPNSWSQADQESPNDDGGYSGRSVPDDGRTFLGWRLLVSILIFFAFRSYFKSNKILENFGLFATRIYLPLVALLLISPWLFVGLLAILSYQAYSGNLPTALVNLLEKVFGPLYTSTHKEQSNLELGSAGETASEARSCYQQVLEVDSNFSFPLFREFAVLLYSQAISEMPQGDFPQSRRFLSAHAVNQLTTRGHSLDTVHDVVVGSVVLKSANVGQQALTVGLELESNYLAQVGAKSKGFLAKEHWTLERRLDRLTQPPKPVSSLTCPGCGYGGDVPTSGVCPQCGITNQQGEFDWLVKKATVVHTEELHPHQAEGSGVETGTESPTVVHHSLGRRREHFLTRHPDFQWPEFWKKASGIFTKLQQAWSQRDAAACRPYETDTIFRMHRYWIEDYRRQGKINQLSRINIERWELSDLVLDAYYETIVARVFASMVDVTTDEGGTVLYGDPSRTRSFSEYWTFIRRVGHKTAKTDILQGCPSCGGPLDRINHTGECEYCHTVVTMGDFDWVLSNIEQDEVYRLSS